MFQIQYIALQLFHSTFVLTIFLSVSIDILNNYKY